MSGRVSGWIDTRKLVFVQRVVKRLDGRFIRTMPSQGKETLYCVEFECMKAYRSFSAKLAIIEMKFF